MASLIIQGAVGAGAAVSSLRRTIRRTIDISCSLDGSRSSLQSFTQCKVLFRGTCSSSEMLQQGPPVRLRKYISRGHKERSAWCYQQVQSHGQVNQNELAAGLSALFGLLTVISCSESAQAGENIILNPVYGDLGAILEVGVQLIYLGALLVLLGVGSFLVVRQVLIKRELESAAKELQDRVRSGQATSLEYFELGAVMLRKKFYILSRKYLMEAIKKWDGSEQDLAQVYNALGFNYFSDGKVDQAVIQYEKAVDLQPAYVTAWNNLADAYESQKDFGKALKAYEEALQFDPGNQVATARRKQVKEKVDRFEGVPKAK